ncbi:TetR family transcriptional regulator (plasmid) [Mycobacterium intracellulare subsp. yongonense 05-1390]|nr:TetR family transcriptional regulator [Mycobacterium intracellulare subsp. yongonense 05-1390]BDE16973.1 hypothetical protein MKCMC460_58330 [Mycobacterium sp. 20KCMC460]GLC22537.1 hypothetical protein SRL2020472_51080 [Mycobacterium kiyosense]GLC98739.1 hypothetical protein Mkiyose1088_06060 [Mycobacterium kiyosense]GLD08683.1 hypothetical protein Mkiyose1383_50090 [Mycobacterium kiyosense]
MSMRQKTANVAPYSGCVARSLSPLGGPGQSEGIVVRASPFPAEGPAATRAVARDRLLDAAEDCLRDVGQSGTTMEDIAGRAGASRATVYRYFSNRESVMSGVILRATERYLRRIAPRIAEHADLGSAIIDFIEVTVRAAHREPIIGVLFGNDNDLAGVGLTEGTSVALFDLVAEFLRPVFRQRWDQLKSGVSVDDAAEWILRVILSLISVRGPRQRSPDGLDAFLRRFLLPSLLCAAEPGGMQQNPSNVLSYDD